LQAKNEDMDTFAYIKDIQRRIFAGMLSSLDQGIGKIIQKLKDSGLYDNTIIIFISDNGGPTRELTSSNLPLRGEKGLMYEGGIRVPFMIQWNGKIPAGTVYDKPIISLDILPTVATIAGADFPQDLDGVDIMPFITGKKIGEPHESLYWRQYSKTALRMGKWKIVNHKLNTSDTEWELFNLENDLSETNNLKQEYPQEFNRLYQKWNELNGQMIKPLF
jgi:arylsulfatase B